MSSYFNVIRHCVEEERPVVAATVIAGREPIGARLLVFDDGSTEGNLGDPELNRQARQEGLAALRRGAGRRSKLQSADETTVDVFYDVFPSPPTLLIFGGVHIGIPLARFAKLLGFRVRVVDARGRFANEERFAEADEIIIAYADEY